MRNKLVLWLMLLLVGFLAGFIPQYSKSHRIEQNVSALKDELGRCRSSQQLSSLRNTAALMYLEATEKNYGNSSSYASSFFEQAQNLAGTTQEEGLRRQLQDILQVRDQITADLAKGNAAVVSEMQPILHKLFHE